MLLDYELIGDLQVSNGIVSGFNNSTNNYIKIPYSLPMGSNKVEVCISVYFPDFSSGSVILANYNDSSSGGGLASRSDARNDEIKYWAWDSSGTLIARDIDLGFGLTIGTNIIKFIYENSTITWYKSTDGTSFTQGVSQSGTIADFQNYITIGASGTVWSSGNMQVNMLDSYIKVNDEYWHSKEYIKQKTRIIQRHDTVANWNTVNPILALGEMGVETDTNKFKFGDGTTVYSELAYAAEENSIKISKSDTLDTTHFKLENGIVNELDNSFRCSGDRRIIINPNISSANLIVLKVRYRFETNTTDFKTLIGNGNGGHNSTLPVIDNYSSYDLWFPDKLTVGTFPGDSWRNLTLTMNKVNGSLTFYQEDDNGNIIDNWTGYNTGTGRDTSILWTIYQKTNSNSAIIVDTHSLVLIEDGVEYPYYQGSEYTIKHIVIGSGLQASINSEDYTCTISGQDVKTFTGYSDTGTLVLKSINGVLQWVAET